jgi:hypothetical protein
VSQKSFVAKQHSQTYFSLLQLQTVTVTKLKIPAMSSSLIVVAMDGRGTKPGVQSKTSKQSSGTEKYLHPRCESSIEKLRIGSEE